MTSAPTSSPTTILEAPTNLHVMALALIIVLIGFSCVNFGFRYNNYIKMYESLPPGS